MKSPWRVLFEVGVDADDATYAMGKVAGAIYFVGILIFWSIAGWLIKTVAPGSGLSSWFEANSVSVLLVLITAFGVYAFGLSIWKGITAKPGNDGGHDG